MVNSRGGTFTPSQQSIVTGVSHSPHGSHHSTFSAGASPSTSSPTGSNGLSKIAVAQVYLLLSTIKEDKDRTKWEQQAEQLKKLIDENGMEVFQKYFSRLVVGNASTIFPGLNRPVANPANYQILVNEMRKISQEIDQAGKIAESIETANEDLFRDFDLSTFMEHFKLDALEKTILALAFKTGSRSDLKTKADAILSANYQTFLQMLRTPPPEHANISPAFLATIIDRFIQGRPPHFDTAASNELAAAMLSHRNYGQDPTPSTEVMAKVYLLRIVNDSFPFVLALQRIGPAFTTDEDTCRSYIRSLSNIKIDEEQAAQAILYSAISQTSLSPSVLVGALRTDVGQDLNWPGVIGSFDQPALRITSDQFLSIYLALRPLAAERLIDIQRLWGGTWANSETQLSFISAFAALSPEQLDATTIPGLEPSFTLADVAGAEQNVLDRADVAIRHPLVSVAALSAIFQVALSVNNASDTIEARRLFQDVVVPNLDVFLVSAFGIPKPWSDLANETTTNLFDRFLLKFDPHYDFVLECLWRKDKPWVAARLMDVHAKKPLELPNILDHAVQHHWLDELMSMLNGFGLDLAALAHARDFLDLNTWARNKESLKVEVSKLLSTFLDIKAQHELNFQRLSQLHSVTLPVKTISALLDILEKFSSEDQAAQLNILQRICITSYPRLINYGEGFDDVIDANGREGNSLPPEANAKMEHHFKEMYSDVLPVRSVVEILEGYKHSRDPFEQDVFACMIHGLFDEYPLYGTYPLEALATTAVLFGGIISHKLISQLPLKIGLGMILEAVRDHLPEQSMYKFGLQALMQLFSRLPEWPDFCRQLLQIPGLQGTEAWIKAEEVLRNHQEDLRTLGQNGLQNGELNDNKHLDDTLSSEPPKAPPFTSLHVDLPLSNFEDPNDEAQEKVLFVLNNITVENLESKFLELKEVISDKHQQWFAGHLVEERAKMQPNYHKLYLDLVKLFGQKSLWSEILRETYVSVIRMLNSENTMQSAVDRSHLKNLGGWLGSLTLARDKPMLHKNIAFKQLLLEAFDTQRLLIVIPFVCKVLVQGHLSTVFKPPNPWLMDIIHLLMELYHHAELKLNLKFEIEVLCKDLKLDHKVIEPSSEVMGRSPPIEELNEPMIPEMVDRFDNMSLSGIAGVGTGRFSPQDITSSIPDLGPLLSYPPANDMINQGRLQEIVRTAITRSVYEIISPVVERSVTIAAISTAQMIHKDFATEPSEARVRSAAINMVKKTAGSLALVTSKEPLRASMTNHIRSMGQEEIPQGLPEGTIIMCVNSNLDVACSQVEKKAEERAVPEIEDMIESELENRRRHLQTNPREPYFDPGLSRWSWTIPEPYKLQPSVHGLNEQQMAIYDDFAKQPRMPSLGGAAHVASSSDATRSMANDILQDPYPSVPSLPTPAEPPAMPHLNTQQASFGHANAPITNGRVPSLPLDPRTVLDRVQATLADLKRVATDAVEQHFEDLPRGHPVLELLDTLYALLFKTVQSPDAVDTHIVDNICSALFTNVEEELVIECLVQALHTIFRMGGRAATRVAYRILHQPGEFFLSVPLVTALVKVDLIEWQRVDSITSTALATRKEGSLQFLSLLLDTVLLGNQPIALFADLAKSLEVAWQWIEEDPTWEAGLALKQKLMSSGISPNTARQSGQRHAARQDQMEYVFDEWVHLYANPNVTAKAAPEFIAQMYNKQIINSNEDLLLFLRFSLDSSVERFETMLRDNHGTLTDAYAPTDSLAKLIAMLVMRREAAGEVKREKAEFLRSFLYIVVLVLNHHHVMRGDRFNQRVFCRLFSVLLTEFNLVSGEMSEEERSQILVVFNDTFLKLRPAHFPGFLFGWLALISHRHFLPNLMRLPSEAGWEPYCLTLEVLLMDVGDLLKTESIMPTVNNVYIGVLKLLVALNHDYPDFLAAHHSRLVANIPSHCIYFHSLILNANPAAFSNAPDPLQPGLKIDRIEEIQETPHIKTEIEEPLRENGLLDILDRALRDGPGEESLAAIAHEIQKKKTRETGFAFVPVHVDTKLMNAIVLYIGMHAIAQARRNGAPPFVPGSTDAALLSMLVHELYPEARYHLINSIADQLRFPSSHTLYFSQALQEMWGSDQNDQEESDIRQVITRTLLERLVAQWPQPWGLLVTCVEFLKNEKYHFYELPFIKADPEVALRFASLTQQRPPPV